MILVVGATGQLGSMIAHKLLAQGEKVRAFVRKTSDFEGLQKAGAQIVFGDLKWTSLHNLADFINMHKHFPFLFKKFNLLNLNKQVLEKFLASFKQKD